MVPGLVADSLPGGIAVDPQGPATGGEERVMRGGYWGSFPKLCRAANRNGSIPGGRYFLLGFRVVLAPGQ